MGLSGKHHGELNKMNVAPSRYNELRKEYASNKTALQQIDVYDPNTDYREKIRELVIAIKSGNEKEEGELNLWFKSNYPDI